MKKKILIKSTVILLLSIGFGVYLYFKEVKKGVLGKEEYLKNEAIRFDKDVHIHIIPMILASIFLCALIFGVYELLCYFILKITNKKKISN